MLKLLLIVGGLAALGGFVGYTQWFCPDGRCALTGSWWGGATIGGLLGFAVHEGFIARGFKPTPDGTDAEPTPGSDDELGAGRG